LTPFNEGDALAFGEIALKAINLPGHSDDSKSVLLKHDSNPKKLPGGKSWLPKCIFASGYTDRFSRCCVPHMPQALCVGNRCCLRIARDSIPRDATFGHDVFAWEDWHITVPPGYHPKQICS